MADTQKITCRVCLNGPVLDPEGKHYCPLRYEDEKGPDGEWRMVDKTGDPDHERCVDDFEVPLAAGEGYILQDGCWNCDHSTIEGKFNEGWISQAPDLLCHERMQFVDAPGRCGWWVDKARDADGCRDVLVCYARKYHVRDDSDGIPPPEKSTEENVDEGKEPETNGSGNEE